MKNKIVIFLFLIYLFLLFTGCNVKNAPSTFESSSLNTANIILKIGGKEYYYEKNKNNNKYYLVIKIKNSIKELTEVSGPICSINYYKNNLCFIESNHQTGDDQLVLFNLSSKEKKVLSKNVYDRGIFLQIHGDDAYFEDKLKLIKINLITFEQETVVDDIFAGYDISNNMLYYSNEINNPPIIKRKSLDNDKDSSVVAKTSATCLKMYNGELYYINASHLLGNRGHISKIDQNGNQVNICDDISSIYNIYQNYIFYNNISDGHALYRMTLDGKGKTKILDKKIQGIYVYGNELFCTQ